jgi:hypothetical protein
METEGERPEELEEDPKQRGSDGEGDIRYPGGREILCCPEPAEVLVFEGEAYISSSA